MKKWPQLSFEEDSPAELHYTLWVVCGWKIWVNQRLASIIDTVHMRMDRKLNTILYAVIGNRRFSGLLNLVLLLWGWPFLRVGSALLVLFENESCGPEFKKVKCELEPEIYQDRPVKLAHGYISFWAHNMLWSSVAAKLSEYKILWYLKVLINCEYHI